MSASTRVSVEAKPGRAGLGVHDLVSNPWAFGLATIVLALVCSVFVFHPFTPSFPEPGLDPSWIVVMGEAAAAHARWGVDLAFTYGPASPLSTLYYNGQYFTLTLPLLLAISIIDAFCALCLFRTLAVPGRHGVIAPTLATICYAVALVAAHQLTDAFFLTIVFLVFLLDQRRDPQDRVARAAVILGIAATGAFGLAKMSYGLCGLALFGLADIGALIRRRWPFRTPLMGLVFVALYLAYGQRLGDLPAFILMQEQVIAGYSEAMSLAGNRAELISFVLAAAALTVVVGWVELSSPRPWIERLILPLGLAAFLVLTLKSGFVRHDLHSLIAWVVLGFAGLLLAFDGIMARTVRGGTALAVASLLILTLICPYVIALAEPDVPLRAAMADVYRSWWRDGPPGEIAGMRKAMLHPAAFASALDRTKASRWADIRKQSPLPKLEGAVDVIQSEQSTILANGLDYHPRPSFQEYNTYTPKLIAANKAFYESSRAPDWVLFAPGSIDDRDPALAEGALWPDLIRRYEPVRDLGDRIALHKRAQPLEGLMGAPSRRDARFDTFVPVDGFDPVFARIIVTPNWLGRLAGLLFRPPMLDMVVKFAGGREQSSRFFPVLGAAGFFLSPVVGSAKDFALLAFGETDPLADNRVAEVKVVGTPWGHRFFAPTVTFEFTHVSVEHIPHSDAAAPLFDALTRPAAWRALVRGLGLENELDGDRLSAQPPNDLVLPTRGARRIRLGFGIEDGAWNPGQSRGVCFEVREEGRSETLWKRCLEPNRTEGDRGDQSAVIDIRPGLDKVVLQTSCIETCDWGWSYWNGFQAED